MPIDGFDIDVVNEIDQGLSLLGWTTYHRLTSDETMFLWNIARRASTLNSEGALDETAADNLALQAYDILQYSLVTPRVRAWNLVSLYAKSPHLSTLITFIDEATLAFFHGYYTVSLASLFIVLEQYLRSVIGWQPGHTDVKFKDLKEAVKIFPQSRARNISLDVLNGLYARYDAMNPPLFYFNRHGLLHGLRKPLQVDEMNCGRTFLLLDLLALAETNSGTGAVVVDEELQERIEAYEECDPSIRRFRLLGHE